MSPGDVDMHGLALALDAQRVIDGRLRADVALEAARRRVARMEIEAWAAGVLARAMVGQEKRS